MPPHSQMPGPAIAPAAVARERQAGVIAVLCLAPFMASLDLFIVNVAFDDIGREFTGASLSDLSWILNGYAIIYAALLVPLGRLSDRFGRKEGFLLGLGLFTLASLACALSPGLWWLVAFRALQAIGAAALTPTSLGLLLNAVPAARRVRTVRIWAATGALAAAVGPVLGGLLVSASWRWIFLVNIPIGLGTLIAAWILVPDSTDDNVRGVPDLLGAAVAAVSVGALSLALVKGPDWGWASPGTLAGFAVAAIGLVLFWRRSHRHPMPVIEPDLLKVRAFAWANASMILFSMTFAISLLVSILWMQQVWHYSALRTGLAVAPGPLLVPVFAAVAQSLANRIPVGVVTAAGCLLSGAGALLTLLLVGQQPAYASELLPGWLIGGVGVGLALPTLLSAATADLPQARSATGSAVVNMSRQLGTVLGVSALVVLIGTPAGYAAAHTGFQHAWAAGAVFALLGGICALGMTPRGASKDAAPAGRTTAAA